MAAYNKTIKDLKKFVVRSSIFLLLLLLTLSIGLLYKDAAPSLLNAHIDKHELLRNAGSPKIILLGGSNVSFGINSHLIHEHFNMPVVNMGLYAEIGLKYMMHDIRPFVGESDIVVLLPEYANFLNDSYMGSRGLVALLFDVYPEGLKYINIKQWLHLAPYLVNYAAVKVKRLPDYLTKKITGKKEKKNIGVYDRRSFNQFGDAHIHWTMAARPIPPGGKVPPGSVSIRKDTLTDIKDFKNFLESKNAKMAVFPPCLNEKTYQGMKWIVDDLAKVFKDYGFKPERYVFPEELCFDSPYHLIKKGLDIRTARLIEDLEYFLSK